MRDGRQQMRAGLAAPGDLGRIRCDVDIFELEGALESPQR